jgi:large subunit ribosomal protein L3
MKKSAFAKASADAHFCKIRYTHLTKMVKFILGQKIKMSQVFDEKGNVIPVTSVVAEPLTVVKIKTKDIDGYEAVQIGFGTKKIKKPQKKLGFRHLKEFRIPEGTKISFNAGDKIDVSIFQEGDKVEISGVTKAKGFQGVVKRHGFRGGPRTHGQKHSEREPGSIGATAPQRVFKGTRMAGRMGGNRITVKNLKIIKVDKDKNELWISGAVPGRRGTLLEIKSH